MKTYNIVWMIFIIVLVAMVRNMIKSDIEQFRECDELMERVNEYNETSKTQQQGLGWSCFGEDGCYYFNGEPRYEQCEK